MSPKILRLVTIGVGRTSKWNFLTHTGSLEITWGWLSQSRIQTSNLRLSGKSQAKELPLNQKPKRNNIWSPSEILINSDTHITASSFLMFKSPFKSYWGSCGNSTTLTVVDVIQYCVCILFGNLQDDALGINWGMLSDSYILWSTTRHFISLNWRRHSAHCSIINTLPHASDSPSLNICKFTGFQQRQSCVIQQSWFTEHLLVCQNNTDFLLLLVICSLVSWLEANRSLSSLFITVTQSGDSGLQWVLINDSTWQLKAFRRMIFQLWAGIQLTTQKHHSYIFCPRPPHSSSSHSDNSLLCCIALPLQFYWKCSHWLIIKLDMTACAHILQRWRRKGGKSFSCNRQSWQQAWSKVLKVRHSSFYF